MKNRKFWISLIAAILAGVMVLSLLAGLFASTVSATSSSELKNQLDQLESEKGKITDKLKDLEKQQAANLDSIEEIIKQKGIIDQQIALLYEEISNVNKQISLYSLLISDKQAELEAAEARLQELSEQNKERIRAMEEEGSLSLWSVIFEANSFSDLLDRIDMIAEISKADHKRLEEMSRVAQEVEEARDALAEEKAGLEKVRVELEETQKILDAKNAEADQLLAALVGVSEDLDKLHDDFERQEEDFLDEIAKKEQEYNNKLAEEKESSRKASIQASIEASIEASIAESKWKETSTNKPNSGGNQGSDSNPSGVIWRVPCDYIRVSSAFGYRWHPTTGEWSMHKGVDLAAPKGTPIYATRSGYVTIATYHSTAGNYVTINHQDGYSSVYMHMTHYVVGVGDYVKAGQLIGYVGSTGRSTGPHLHFGISYNGTYVNPMDYIG